MSQEENQRSYETAKNLLSEQNFLAAIIVGAITSFFAAALYSILIGWLGFLNGFAAAAIGIAVGISARFSGHGIETRFAVTAAIFTIAACILGSLFSIEMTQPQGHADSLLEFVRDTEFSLGLGASISFVDLIFWLVAAWFAAFLAIRSLSRAERLAIGLYQLKG